MSEEIEAMGPGVTDTSEGPIPHLRHGDLLCPVKLERVEFGSGWKLKKAPQYGYGNEKPMPMRRNGRLVYALPGGGEVVA